MRQNRLALCRLVVDATRIAVTDLRYIGANRLGKVDLPEMSK